MFRHADVVCLCLVCIQWQLSMLVEDARGDHTEKTYSRASLITALWVAMFIPSCCSECFYDL